MGTRLVNPFRRRWPKPYRPNVSLAVRIAVPIVVFIVFLLGTFVGVMIPVLIFRAFGITGGRVMVVPVVLGGVIGMGFGYLGGYRLASRLFGLSQLDVQRLIPDPD